VCPTARCQARARIQLPCISSVPMMPPL
jgi:hypothetical protein